MSLHLMLDMGSGLLLAASPWIFGFSDELKWFHVIVGLGEIAAAAMTRTHPHRTRSRASRALPARRDRRLVRLST
jgi:hypothetical protein